jgi:hypothetical protein
VAHHRHKREPNARRFSGFRVPQLRSTVLAAPLAVAATVGAVSIGVLGAGGSTVDVAAPAARDAVVTQTGDPSGVPRLSALSRGYSGRLQTEEPTEKPSAAPSKSKAKPVTKTPLERLLAPAAVRAAIARADTKRWTTEPLNLWTTPSKTSARTGTVEEGKRVLLTGRELAGRVEIVWGTSQTRWVTDGYLTDEKPVAPEAPVAPAAGCTNGTTVPDAVSPNVKLVHTAVCAAFPDITTYGTFRNDGEHSQGLAVDIMVSGDRGREIAEFLRARAGELGVNYLIYQQQIWSVERGGEGWRGMEDRGSVTANHFDHVHVTVF